MPISNFPFTKVSKSFYLPILNIIIHNSHNGVSPFKTKGLIDTGADECAIPADYAKILGHELELGTPKTIHTASGPTTAYSHSTKIDILHYKTEKVI